MEIIHATLGGGEGKEAAELLDNLGVDIEDYKVITSESGDLLIINLIQKNVNRIIDKLKDKFDFDNNKHRSLVIYTPDLVIPDNSQKEDIESKSSRETIVAYAKQQSKFTGQIFFLALMAAIIASVGLIIDNIAVIVGAMIIAPVFGPIAAMSIGIVLGDLKLLIKGFFTEVLIIIVAILAGVFFGKILPSVEITNAMKIRSMPTFADIIVAAAAGSAGAYALIVNIKSQQLVGVVIAAALIPVMATTGVGIAILDMELILGSFMLLLANFFALILSIVLVFYFKGLKPQWWYEPEAKKMIKKSLIIISISIAVLMIPLSTISYNEIIRPSFKTVIKKIYNKELDSSDINIIKEINFKKGEIEIIIYEEKEISSEKLSEIKEKIDKKLGKKEKITFKSIRIQKLE